ncbi:hypothetical protein CK497_07730 [Vreelandella alkaliphila]|uniref:Uncharacterized protein n=1 Tax=Vreelandella alkaliphila TaxID=272774 RepID=A0ABX4HLG1_9GAMM|nr:hypothetical protein CK497_07730 [Halomonas humidisoli]
MRHPQRQPDAKDGRTTLNGTKSRHTQLYHAGALTLTPRYKTCAFNTFVARCNESREEQANEAPSAAARRERRQNNAQRHQIQPQPALPRGCADAYAALQNLCIQYVCSAV